MNGIGRAWPIGVIAQGTSVSTGSKGPEHLGPANQLLSRLLGGVCAAILLSCETDSPMGVCTPKSATVIDWRILTSTDYLYRGTPRPILESGFAREVCSGTDGSGSDPRVAWPDLAFGG